MTEQERLEALTRKCGACGEEKPWSAFSVQTRWSDGTIRTVRSHCRLCDVARVAEYQEAHPEKYGAEARREYRREYAKRPDVIAARRARQNSPEAKARRNEYEQRPEVRARRQELAQRAKTRAYKKTWERKRQAELLKERGQNGSAGGRVSVEPLREFLRKELRFRNELQVAEITAVNVRRIRGIITAEYEQVGIVQADRIITRLDGSLEEHYPYEEAA